MVTNSIENINMCGAYIKAKMSRPSFPISKSKADKCFDLIHLDVWGSALVEGFNTQKYYVTFVDDKSKATRIYILNKKSEVIASLK